MGAAARSALLRTLRRQICALSCGYALKQGSMFDRVVKVSVRDEVGEPACAVWCVCHGKLENSKDKSEGVDIKNHPVLPTP